MRGTAWLSLLAACGVATVAHAGDALRKQPYLKCSACRVVSHELFEKKARVLEKNANLVQVSHRLGKNMGGGKKMNYADSELMAIDTMEGLCESSDIKNYLLRYNDTSEARVFSRNSSLPAGESYSKGDKDVASSPGKHLTLACHELFELHDEEVAAAIRQDVDAATLEHKLCHDISELCKHPKKLLSHEHSARKSHEEWRRNRIDKSRRDGSARNFQLAEIHLSFDGVVLNLTALNATAVSESGRHPPTEGPGNAIDGNDTTKWLDHDKKSITIAFPTDVTIDAFTFTTANDYPERDPVRWEFAGLVATEGEPEPAASADSDKAAEGTPSDKAEELDETADDDEPVEEWTVLHSVVDVPHDVPHNRTHQLEWFSFTSATHRKFRFKPIAKVPKKKKKKSKKAEGPSKTDSSDKGEL